MSLIVDQKGISYRSNHSELALFGTAGKRNLKRITLVLSCALALCISAPAVTAQIQQDRGTSHADLFRGQTLPRNAVAPVGHNAELTEIQRLLDLQNTITGIVEENMPAVVAVTDGIGFGSGVVISPDGLVLTAGHVMMRNGEYEVAFPDGRTVTARPLGRNLDIDAGMVQITEPGPWPYVELADRTPQPGDWVVALGHSGGIEMGRKPPVRTGRYLERRNHQMVTDAVLIGGDSGGPLFDTEGKVVAIHSSIGDTVAENRHVFVSEFQKHWDRMQSGERWGELPELTSVEDAVDKPKIGVTVDRSLGNARLLRVKEDSAAEKAGLRTGDVIVEFNRREVTGAGQLIDLIQQQEPGDIVPIAYVRNGILYRTVVELD
ncbi:MAG: S1C family serine protease [Planctomycetota bacterium]